MVARVMLSALVAASGCSPEGNGPEGMPAELGPSSLRRLTRWEYNNTVRDLLADDTKAADAFVPDELVAGFAANAMAPVTRLALQQYQDAGEMSAKRAVADVVALVGCDPAAGEVCAETFARDFGRLAYRRPVTTADIEAVLGLYRSGLQDGGFVGGIENAVAGILQSPNFLYRLEFGEGSGEIVRLTGYEVATRLSYFLWNSTPDHALLDSAQTGELATRAGVAQAAQRLLDDPRAAFAMANFHLQWLELGEPYDSVRKDPTVFPDVDADVLADMRVETALFVDHVLRAGDGRLETLLTSNRSFVNDRLAALYGVPAPAQGFEAVELDPLQRRGLLTQGSVLAVHAKSDQTSPILRGKLVRERLLCQTPPPPPPNVDVTLPGVDAGATARERFAQHASDPACSGCHQLMDPIGFAFEHYDATGAWRDTEGGAPIDASGEIIGADPGTNGTVDGVIELSQILAASAQVRRCVFDQWFAYAFGRAPAAEDQDVVDEAYQAFEDADAHVPTLLLSLAQSDGFRFRRRK